MKRIEKVRLSLAFRILPKRFREDAAAGMAAGAIERIFDDLEAHLDECPDCQALVGDDAE